MKYLDRKSRAQLTKEDRNAILSKFKELISNDKAKAQAAMAEVATAIQVPLRETLLSGDIVGDIFEYMDFTDNPRVEFPLDVITPGQEREFYAYCSVGEGRIPERRVEGDFIMVTTYPISNSIDCTKRFIRDANWPVIQRMLEILEGGFIKKMNDDGWQTILSSALSRNMLIYDPNAAIGQFTPRLVTLMSTFMRRNGGGNSATLGRSRLTDLYVSPEAHMDMRAWTLLEVPDPVRTNIYYANEADQDLITVYGVKIHALDELGEGQEYQNYYSTTINGTMASTDVEMVIGLDLQQNGTFVHPVREDISITEDNTVDRRGIFSLYGCGEIGFAVLDSRRTVLGSI